VALEEDDDLARGVPRPDHLGAGPHHETFSTTTQPPHSSAKG
jgi:hypothetical protein